MTQPWTNATVLSFVHNMIVFCFVLIKKCFIQVLCDQTFHHLNRFACCTGYEYNLWRRAQPFSSFFFTWLHPLCQQAHVWKVTLTWHHPTVFTTSYYLALNRSVPHIQSDSIAFIWHKNDCRLPGASHLQLMKSPYHVNLGNVEGWHVWNNHCVTALRCMKNGSHLSWKVSLRLKSTKTQEWLNRVRFICSFILTFIPSFKGLK